MGWISRINASAILGPHDPLVASSPLDDRRREPDLFTRLRIDSTSAKECREVRCFRVPAESLLTDSLLGRIIGIAPSQVYKLTPVRNQLNSVIEIVDYVRHEAPDNIRRLENAQTTGNTRGYLDVFDELGYVRIDEGTIYHGPKMESADMQGMDEEEIIGDIIDEGYYLLRQKLGLGMLNHFPKFANACYLSALRRNRPQLHLTLEDIAENLSAEHQDDMDIWKIRRKLESLDEVEVLNFKDREVTGRDEIYGSVEANMPSIG